MSLIVAILASVTMVRAESAVANSEKKTLSKSVAQKAPVVVTNARIRFMPEGVSGTGLYMTLTNNTDQAMKLTSVEVLGQKDHKPLAKKIMFSQTLINGTIKKTESTSSIDILPRRKTMLRPNSTHIVLEGLNRPLKEGDVYAIKLAFANKATVFSSAKVGKVKIRSIATPKN